MDLAAASVGRGRAGAAVALAVAAAALYLLTGLARYDGKWLLNSPDEAATALAVERFGSSGSLVVPTLGPWSADLQRPRSVQPTASGWAPGSFIGQHVTYGAVAALAGLGGALVFGAALAGFGVWLSFRLVTRMGGPTVGLLAAAATAVSPAYWSTATHPLWQALPTLVLVLLAAELLLSSRGRTAFLFWCGVVAGAAVAVRSTEALWVIPALLLAAWYLRVGRKLGWIAAGLALPLMATAWLYVATYAGTATAFAYDVSDTLSAGNVLQPRLGAVARNVWLYLVQLQWWLVALAVVGKWAILRRTTQVLPVVIVAALVVAAQLVTYGGLVTFDSPGLAEPTIGNSHVRYWLPTYVLVAWLAGYGISALWATVRYRALATAAGLAALVLSAQTVLLSPGDGVFDVRRTLAVYGEERRAILQLVPEGTLVVAGRSDKLLLGDRPVTAEVHPSQWPAVAAGLREGYAAAIYGLAPAQLPAEAVAAGVEVRGTQRTEVGRYLSWLTVR